MPTPSTSKFPKPRSDDEFEDIVVDALRVRWKDPNAQRNGRSGQKQHGVDICGRPDHLGGAYAGAQCKNTESLTLKVVVEEATSAKEFRPPLAEFLVVTSADRDAKLQREVREHFAGSDFPFHVDVLFWRDITSDISEHDALVEKHWKGFGGRTSGAGTSTDASDPFPPSPHWADRSNVKPDETAECQCELAIWLGPPLVQLEASEFTAELRRSSGAGSPYLMLADRPPIQESGLARYSALHRTATNVVDKWEMDIGRSGFFALRWAQFRSGDLRLFDVLKFVSSVVKTTLQHRAAVDSAVRNLGIEQPKEWTMRLSAHGSGPLVLHDEIGLRTSVLSSYRSPPDWTTTMTLEWRTPLKVTLVRALHRVFSSFSPETGAGESAAFGSSYGVPLQLNEQALADFLSRNFKDA
jgi:hypothetical protein